MGLIDLSDPSLNQAWKTITADTAIQNWILFDVDDRTDKVKVAGIGDGGMNELKMKLNSERIQIGAFKVTGVDPQVASRRRQFIWFIYIGSSIPALRKGQIRVQRPEVVKLFQGAVLDVEITSPEQLDKQIIAKKLLGSSGAHKPEYYEFAPGDTVPVANLA